MMQRAVRKHSRAIDDEKLDKDLAVFEPTTEDKAQIKASGAVQKKTQQMLTGPIKDDVTVTQETSDADVQNDAELEQQEEVQTVDAAEISVNGCTVTESTSSPQVPDQTIAGLTEALAKNLVVDVDAPSYESVLQGTAETDRTQYVAALRDLDNWQRVMGKLKPSTSG